jgi:hypothetical protein
VHLGEMDRHGRTVQCVRACTDKKKISCLPATAIMIVYAVIHHAKLIGLYSCGCDAAEMA